MSDCTDLILKSCSVGTDVITALSPKNVMPVFTHLFEDGPPINRPVPRCGRFLRGHKKSLLKRGRTLTHASE